MKRQENQSIEQLQFFEEDKNSEWNENRLEQGEEADRISEQNVLNESEDTVAMQALEKESRDERIEDSVKSVATDATEEASTSVSENNPSSSIKPLEEFQKKLEEEKQNKEGKKTDNKQNSILIELLDVIRSVAVWFFITWLVATYVAKPIRIDGTSMYPTLHHGDFGFSNIIGLKMGELRRFEVVVVYEPWLNDFVIKRIIGLPGETVSYKDNQLLINGAPVEEQFFDEEYTISMMAKTNDYFTNDFSEVTLGLDEYFIMGDNRPKSSDSREYGPIKKSQIISKSTLILFPFQNIGVH